ncbi:hypothetical protein ECB94_27730 (plasmid) [Vibrio mediterranei]|uniref:HTH-like domain-containing protein n=1 Tax=Vibrio mediterranei TaxID=689 RepID=A0A3G4VM60_9VIBR|nr:hypothetical protein ECB94_27730 [Vibrio mediterranei]
MLMSRSAYYAWRKRPAKAILAASLNLYRRIKTLFKKSRGSLGNREMIKAQRKEGVVVGRYKVRSIIKSLGLKAVQRQAYKVTTKRKHSDKVADNLLNQNFNTVVPNQMRAGDVTYLKTEEGWRTCIHVV